jgi:ribosomal protein S18 acetylase RimI-like enzyme
VVALIPDSRGFGVIAIRPMVEADIPAALALWQGMSGIGLREADSPPALARYLVRNPGTSFVALSDRGELVGVSLAGHDGRRGYLHHVAVATAYRKQGVGRKLVAASLAALKLAGIEKVLLFVKTDNDAGMAFWRKCGWNNRPDIVPLSIILGDNPNA